jgi:hypothetical protein
MVGNKKYKFIPISFLRRGHALKFYSKKCYNIYNNLNYPHINLKLNFCVVFCNFVFNITKDFCVNKIAKQKQKFVNVFVFYYLIYINSDLDK